MRPSRNAIIGYSYQKMIAFLLLTKMDVEREILQIEIEADVNNNFDDVTVKLPQGMVYCQMKDFLDVELSHLNRIDNNFIIKGTPHRLSDQENVIFIKDIEIKSNSEIMGIPAYNIDGVFIVSISRDSAWEIINEFYNLNEKRISVLERFFDKFLDERKLVIKRSDLPHIEVYSTELMEKTVQLQEVLLNDSNIIKIEGKPGVGKSHLVNQLNFEKGKLLYRFWVSNQDKNYKARLEYRNFISNITKELFQNYLTKTEEDVICKLCCDNLTLIIDGLDHVENYNIDDLPYYIDFINRVGLNSKVIVLSRPIKTKTNWETKVINNWNFEQTKIFLDELYHITEYSIIYKIYEMTKGYPILLSFLAKHYKKFNVLPSINEIEDIDDYYNKIARNISVKASLKIFLTSHSFFMKSEIEELLDSELVAILNEFIEAYPYLFEIRLNRISLVHDSFNTYLKNQNIDYNKLENAVHNKVFESLMMGEKRYISRFIYFGLSAEMKLKIVHKYASIDEFNIMVKNCVDFESVQSFYSQIRQVIDEFKPESLSLIQYYDLSLIYNVVHRDHISSLNKFLYTYARCLLFNGFTPDVISSSDYVFSMIYYLIERDIALLNIVTSDDNYITDNFYFEFLTEIEEEDGYFDNHFNPIELSQSVEDNLKSGMEYSVKDIISHILVNTYIHGTNELEFYDIQRAIILYVDRNEKEKAISIIKRVLEKYGVRAFFAPSLLTGAKNLLESLGLIKGVNDYRALSLNDYIEKYSSRGSFQVLERVQNYLRLSLKDNRKIDISSISKFLTMYNERKDYSVINIHEALTVFEKKELINEVKSSKIIVNVQSMSEKGIRHVLENYIEIHASDILKVLEENFELSELQIEWFELSVDYINTFSSRLFDVAMKKIIHYNSGSRKVRISDIENALTSKYKADVLYVLSIVKFTIEIPENHYLIKSLKRTYANLEIIPEEKNSQNRNRNRNSLDRYQEGILTYEDIDFIRSNAIKVYEVAAFTDGYYSLLSDVQIFTIYSKEDIQKNIKKVLFNAMIGKIKNINMYGYMYYFVGNIPRILFDNDIELDWNEIFSSFNVFLEISKIRIDSTENDS